MEKNILPVSAIITTYKTKDFALKALAALYAAASLPKQVIVIDNNSNDGTVEALRAAFPQAEYVVNEKDLGYAGSNNRAIREFATEPYVWLLSSDTETGAHSMEQLYQFIELHPEVGAVGPQLVYPDRSWQSVGGFFPTPLNVFLYLLPITKLLPAAVRRKLKLIGLFPQAIPDGGIELDYVTGAAILLRKKALDKVGLMSEDFYMYFEDTDLCLRLRKDNWKCVVINSDPVMHVYGGSFKTKYDKRRLKITLDSLVLFINKHYSGWKKYVMIFEVKLLGPMSLLIKRLKNILP
ncbi:MAG TPA: glycosyltransferase family 2 protein [Candidatus Udaeobacter sp.]|nr:glycosyltransferase family 2 protein [Candidatus Udaeobacter sp.]